MELFNSKIFFDNIDYLIKSQNRKIGEVENEAGVSAGYISRTSKEGGSKPGIDFILNVAKVLHVSVDILLTVNIASLTPTEKYLLAFLEKLEHDTASDSLAWERESAESLNNLSTDINGNPEHPLFESKTVTEPDVDDYPHDVTLSLFVSRAFDVHTAIHGDCFKLRLKNHAYLYIMNIIDNEYFEDGQNPCAIELWMTKPTEIPQFLCTDYGDSKLAGFIDNLYTVVVENSKHPKLNPEFRYIIDSYMNNDNQDDAQQGVNNDDDIPF